MASSAASRVFDSEIQVTEHYSALRTAVLPCWKRIDHKTDARTHKANLQVLPPSPSAPGGVSALCFAVLGSPGCVCLLPIKRPVWSGGLLIPDASSHYQIRDGTRTDSAVLILATIHGL